MSDLVNVVSWYAYKWNELVEESGSALITLKSFDRTWGFQSRGFKPFIGTPKAEQEVIVWDLAVAHTDLTQDAEVLWNPAFIYENGGYQRMYITMDLVKVVSKNENISNSFLYFLMKHPNFKWHCVGYSNWTTVLHLSKRAIPEYKVALPECIDEKLADASNLFDWFTKKISCNISQIQSLSKARDSLLPKLMGGEVRIGNF